ncbi:hypothetical protein GCL60_11730 [Silvanigrella paludirubra]|uniref:Methyl-accepting transducer domain-containing protein n=1 Tax=Silvanigrella paludirubra TaxID=2499159 RepID=A0A6N6VS58_9BACT|nr:methyl-accepting chemotaxis protein [Silvanigrella paludirubra]KAB8037838.1 hypothetical protein GCL60_11730 [Silvanigrella paludirubra]
MKEIYFADKFSLKLKILILCLAGSFSIFIISIIFAFFNFNSQEDLIKERMYQSAEDLSNSIQDQFYERYGDAKTFALYFKNISGYSKEEVNYLNKLVKFYGFYNLILVCDLNGKLIVTNDENADGKKINSEILYKENFSQTNWFKETLTKRYSEDAAKGFTQVNIQKPDFNEIIEKVYKEKIYSTIFSTLIYNSKGDTIAILSTHPNFYWVENTVTRMYDNFVNSNIKTLHVSMLDKDFNVILDYNPSKNGNKTELVHDEKILNKYNLLKSGQPAALKLSKGEEGTLESINSRYKVKQINAYKNVVGKKIVDDIGWKLLVRFDSSEAYARTNYSRNIFLVLFLIIFLIITGISYYFGTFLANKLKHIANSLSKGNQILIQTSTEATSDSQKLSTSATQQATSLHETVSAVNEINAMMSKSSEMAISSQKKSEENILKVNEGKKTIHNMILSINNIKQSNQEIMEEVLESNKNISSIIKVISEIEHKTKVINEIVFQTKLLSFNASVEAARAGEHGRGFSVVAEEVGNLAKMSGNASNEISTLLENSINKVQSIINQTKNNIDQILTKSKNTIKEGEEVSKECVDIFEQILINTEEVNTLVYEITNSAKEQAKGIYKINNAMHELDNVTNQNNSIAEKTTQTAHELLKQSNELEAMAKSLMEIINGNGLNILEKVED